MKEKLVVAGGKSLGTIKHPKFPVFSKRAIDRASGVIENGPMVALSRWSSVIDKVEKSLSKYHDGRHALGLSSGHASLQASLIGLDVGPGDEVITTPYTWGASISCILHQGAIPVFGDVDRNTGLLDAKCIEALITKRTKAILVVHLYGQPANMPAIMRVAKKNGLKVIEDGSQAHGATWNGKRVGNFGDAAGFSCMGGKLLATGEAGYMVTPHEDVYWRACLSTQHMGRSGDPGFPEEWREYVDPLQYTYRMSSVMAVLLEEQLKKLDKEIDCRQENVDTLRDLLKDSKHIRFPNYGKSAKPAYHMVTMNFRAGGEGVSRDAFVLALRAEGMPVFSYVASPITTWKRMNWRGYEGPKVMWMDNLRRAKVDYAAVEIPNCQYKLDHAIEMAFNFIKPAKKQMELIASMVHRVEGNMDQVREYELKLQGV